MKKRIMGLTACMLTAGLMAGIMGCSAGSESKTEITAYKTVDGKTEGNASKSSDDNGSASFDVKGNHVKMTNFEFDADSSLKVEAEIEDEDLVFTQVYISDEDDNVIYNIADGHYREDFTKENAAAQLSDIYRSIFETDEDDFEDDVVTDEEGVLVMDLELTDGELILMGKEGSDEYASIAFTTTEYGAQEIVDAAFDALD